jgi:MFS family permease
MQRNFLFTIPKTIWFLGAAMCLINTSVVIIFSLSSLFLNTAFGVSALWIGIMEHGVEGLSFLMKLFSGVFSDYLKNRKRLMVIGYALTVISKPLIAMSTGFYSVSASRIIERFGNGIQSTPRDALIGDIAPPHLRGTCYGFQRGLGILGSVLGSFLAYLAMLYFQNSFQSVFFVASIPAFLALILLIVFVKEPKREVTPGDVIVKSHMRHPIHLRDALRLGKTFWLLMIVVAIFWIARVSEGLLVIHAHKHLGLEKADAPLIMVAYNITYCATSFTCGFFSDRFGRYWLLAATMVVLMFADYILFNAMNVEMIFAGILVWGVQMGMSMNLFTATIADLAPEDLRGTAFGCYYLISALATFVAGFVNGGIAENFGVGAAFKLSMALAATALFALLVFLPKLRQNQSE